ncbi:probable carboxylesterase 16 [Impatiens glandulifera]|uniref:probable carboxylesterase 16 n=1 Tax=Impatiens glandulifera TaxID=253017 RepID=UPI001FB0C832|nr:probable carboxylesterase 16 [Impatiens glandulifera]
MPGVTVKLYSVLFKFLLKRRLETLADSSLKFDSFGVTSRPDEPAAAAKPFFGEDGVATKDIHIDPLTSLSLRIFLPESAISRTYPVSTFKIGSPRYQAKVSPEVDAADGGSYGGYSPAVDKSCRNLRKLPVILQFHGGGFVSGCNDGLANDLFCRRIAKLLDSIVISVGYRLAPESRYPAAFEDGMNVLRWLGKQANLVDCIVGGGSRRLNRQQIVDGFGVSMVEPWLAAHGDPSRCLLLGVSCGSNIANYIACKAREAGKLLDPVKIVGQVLMYPFFIGTIPTPSEIKLANSYFYDKANCILAWKLFLPNEEFSLDHPAANPLKTTRNLRQMPPTLTVVAEHDWMRDRAIAYSEELRKANVDAPLLDYKDAVHEFATLDVLLKTPQALACADDIAIWAKKYISPRGHEFSY